PRRGPTRAVRGGHESSCRRPSGHARVVRDRPANAGRFRGAGDRSEGKSFEPSGGKESGEEGSGCYRGISSRILRGPGNLEAYPQIHDPFSDFMYSYKSATSRFVNRSSNPAGINDRATVAWDSMSGPRTRTVSVGLVRNRMPSNAV